MFVRGNKYYGINKLTDNSNGTVTDLATGLIWMQKDTGPFNWEEALGPPPPMNGIK